MMQNQEFLELLKRDTDFMKTLEKGRLYPEFGRKKLLQKFQYILDRQQDWNSVWNPQF